jgi:hypothetical protein
VGAGGWSGPTAVPFDLPGLKLWIARLASEYANATADRNTKPGKKAHKETKRNAAQLDQLKQELSGSLRDARTEDTLRRLLAAGVVQYIRAAGMDSTNAVPEHVVQDVVAFALWSIVQAPVLPADWQGALACITSPRMADLVAQARSVDSTREPEDFVGFVRVLAHRPLSQGSLNLLRDLGDPARGGPALTALALAASLPRPDKRKGTKTAVTWVFVAAAGGALGAEGADGTATVNRLAREAWDWLSANNVKPKLPGVSSAVGAMPLAASAPRHLPAPGHSASRHAPSIEKLIHKLVHELIRLLTH